MKMTAFTFLLYTADEPVLDYENAIKYQEVCMSRLVTSNMNEEVPEQYVTLDSYFLNGLHPSTVMCSWNGVSCTDGLITAMKIHGTLDKSSIVHMGWIPPTVRIFSMRLTMMYGGYSTAALPRELRFFFLEACGDALFRTPRQNSLDFRTLPPKLEEFFSNGSWNRGPVFLDNLPQSLRNFYLRRVGMTKVFIAFETLPEGLHMMWLFTYLTNKPLRIIPTGRVKKDTRVKSSQEAGMESFADATKYKEYLTHLPGHSF